MICAYKNIWHIYSYTHTHYHPPSWTSKNPGAVHRPWTKVAQIHNPPAAAWMQRPAHKAAGSHPGQRSLWIVEEKYFLEENKCWIDLSTPRSPLKTPCRLFLFLSWKDKRLFSLMWIGSWNWKFAEKKSRGNRSYEYVWMDDDKWRDLWWILCTNSPGKVWNCWQSQQQK